jgi:hypothetical protein
VFEGDEIKGIIIKYESFMLSISGYSENEAIITFLINVFGIYYICKTVALPTLLSSFDHSHHPSLSIHCILLAFSLPL